MGVNKFKVGDIVRRTGVSAWPDEYGEKGVDYEVLGLTDNGCIVVIKGCLGADPCLFNLVTDNNNNNKDTTAMTTSKFTETVTTTKTTIKKVINQYLSNGACISIDANCGNHNILLVVGAEYKDRYCPVFNKTELQELINELQAVHDAMESN
jgi:hypothetical protein